MKPSIPMILGFLIAVASGPPGLASPGERRPNVVVFVADDLGYGDLGVQGCRDIATPHIDSIAGAGVRCSSGYVTAPVCSPSRAALMTGRYQQRFGHEFNPRYPRGHGSDYGLALTETTIADRMKAAGYATGIVGKWHLGFSERFNPVHRGFDEFYGFLGGSHDYFPGANQGQEADDPHSGIFRGTKPADMTEYSTDAFGREAVAFVERHKADPFFLYVPFNAVHTPLEAPPDYARRFRHIPDPRRRTYAEMVSAMDDAVGAVLDKLSREGLDSETLVFFFSDNGGPTVSGSDNGPLRGHKATTWEGGIRVPFLVQWKGHLPAGKVYDRPVAQIDILPTALAAAGATVDPAWKLDGVNLLPFLESKEAGTPHEALFWRFGNQTAVRMGDWKLVQGRVGRVRKGGGAMKVSPPELFNLSSDLGETNDLSDRQPETVARLRAEWDKWNADLAPPTWPGPDPPLVP